MNYALLTYEPTYGTYNLGDYVQSIAARQYLPRVDTFLNRESLGKYDGVPAKIILNGWFTHRPETWIPSSKLIPLFVSFHVNSSAADRMLSPAGIDYLSRFSPIGCRDEETVNTLIKHGVPAHFTGCLTLTLSKYRLSKPKRDHIYIVDPFFNCPDNQDIFASPQRLLLSLWTGQWRRLGRKSQLLSKVLSPDLIEVAKFRRHVLPSAGVTESQKFELSETYLKDYANARLVITSRIHCALPCLAMGVPVIFLNGFDDPVDKCRFGGILDLFNRVDIGSDGEVVSNFGLQTLIDGTQIPENPTRHLALAAELRRSASGFASEAG